MMPSGCADRKRSRLAIGLKEQEPGEANTIRGVRRTMARGGQALQKEPKSGRNQGWADGRLRQNYDSGKWSSGQNCTEKLKSMACYQMLNVAYIL